MAFVHTGHSIQTYQLPTACFFSSRLGYVFFEVAIGASCDKEWLKSPNRSDLSAPLIRSVRSLTASMPFWWATLGTCITSGGIFESTVDLDLALFFFVALLSAAESSGTCGRNIRIEAWSIGGVSLDARL